jgi:hypothetical protein
MKGNSVRALFYIAAVPIMAGCASIRSLGHHSQSYPEKFFNSIPFKVDYDARNNMESIMNLQKMIYKGPLVNGKLPDDIAASIFNKVDMDGDRDITGEESRIYLDEVSRKYLDSLPQPNWNYVPD